MKETNNSRPKGNIVTNWYFEYKQREKVQNFKKIGDRHERMELSPTREMCFWVKHV